jgi:hypothetical protein
VQLVAAVEDHVRVNELPVVTDTLAGDNVAVRDWMFNSACAVAGDWLGSTLWQLRLNVKSPAGACC